MTSKETILEEIKSLSADLGQTPGLTVFVRQTGIKKSEWHGKYWRSWGEAVSEAGLEPNSKQGKMDSNVVLEKFAEATRHFQRIPANVDLRMYKKSNEGFPSHNTFYTHFGSKSELLKALSLWLKNNIEYSDIVKFLPVMKDAVEKDETTTLEGLVYLMKSGDFYKIGRSSEIEKRVKQISTSLPEKLDLIHTIKTDDSAGIEAYWHRRFAAKRANGEWFKLTSSDIRAFKRRNFQ